MPYAPASVWAACVPAGRIKAEQCGSLFRMLPDDVRLAIVLRWGGALKIVLLLLGVQVRI